MLPPRDITRAEIVDSWLVWLRAEEGKRALHRVFHWARGVPLWVQAQREHCSERTIVNRIDRSMAAILREFLDVETDVAPIEEAAALPVRHYHAAWQATTGDAGVRESFGKVWIDGIGYMRDGRRLRDGREKTDASGCIEIGHKHKKRAAEAAQCARAARRVGAMPRPERRTGPPWTP
jgi:hypothetical protein